MYEESNLKEQARTLYAGQYVILGDEAYKLSDFLITSIRRDRATSDAQKLFNRLHKSTRVFIEHCFGVLKGRFRALLSEMRSDLNNVQALISMKLIQNIYYSTSTFIQLLLLSLASAIVLHNLLIQMQEPPVERNLSEAEIRQMYDDCDMMNNLEELPTAEVEQNRNKIIQVMWQNR